MLRAILIFVATLFPFEVYAACSWNGNTGTVASPYSSSDVSACIRDASSKTGDIVISIPTATVSWSSSVSADMITGFANVSSLTIQGAGQANTKITNGQFELIGRDGAKWRLTGMTLSGAGGVVVYGNAGQTNPDTNGWRIDNIYFDHSTGWSDNRLIWIQPGGQGGGAYTDHTGGLIDHCTFDNPQGQSYFYRGNPVGLGNNEWERGGGTDLEMGTAESVYMEDNAFFWATCNSECITDTDSGGDFVFRHNTVTNGILCSHDVSSIPNSRGQRKAEVYENTFINQSGKSCWMNVQIRGGNLIVFDNVAQGAPSTTMISIAVYRAGANQPVAPPWDGQCGDTPHKVWLGGSGTYPDYCTSGTGCGFVDGSGPPSGYPCRDQGGWYGGNVQIPVPQSNLFWNNKVDASYVVPMVWYGTGYLVDGRDYCATSGGNPLTAKPATCNGHAVTYTPYTYPHPLQSDSQAPAPPKNLRIIP